ncbi:MAG: ROK family protein [Clostridiales bacterium]|nr:ROK family protein [Clostridiales bacterium]
MTIPLPVPAPLDPNFQPLVLVWRAYQQDVTKATHSQRFVCAIERSGGALSPWEACIFPDDVQTSRTVQLLDRVIKSLLWCRGGFRIHVSGSRAVYEHLKAAYQPAGARAFDAAFMARVYERPFEVLWTDNGDSIAQAKEFPSAVGRHLNGCRIGFDAGGSDRKVSAVIDGQAVYSEEVVWHPKITADPRYHYEGILSAMQTAASHMPRVDAIGVSSAGVYVDNRIMVASLFLQVSPEDFDRHVKTMYIDIAKRLGDVPLVVANDGDVTALAGAMNLNAGNVLGIAMGTSEAGGYVDRQMHITGWLNELAFVPVDYSPESMVDEWSGDYGCGVKYFSQDGAIKLASAAGIPLDADLSPAEKLKVIQQHLAEGHQGARRIFETIGIYFGYAVAYYSMFYQVEHVLIMGRVTSGQGGPLILENAQKVLDQVFPELARSIQLHIPDEKSRRVGQSVAAASLPEIGE